MHLPATIFETNPSLTEKLLSLSWKMDSVWSATSSQKKTFGHFSFTASDPPSEWQWFQWSWISSWMRLRHLTLYEARCSLLWRGWLDSLKTKASFCAKNRINVPFCKTAHVALPACLDILVWESPGVPQRSCFPGCSAPHLCSKG